MASLAASPGRWMTLVRRIYEDFRYGRNTEEMARLFTSPDAVDELRRLMKLNPNSPAAAAVAIRIVANTRIGFGTPEPSGGRALH